MRRTSLLSIYPVLLGALLLTACASGPPSVEQGRVKNKLDLRLRQAFYAEEQLIELGEFVRVVVRTREVITPDFEEAISAYGEPLQALDRFVAVVTTPDRIPWIAVMEEVTFIELDLADSAPPKRPLPPLPDPDRSETIPPR